MTETIGPLNSVEIKSLDGPNGKFVKDLNNLLATERQLTQSLDQVKRKIAQMNAERQGTLREILKCRGVDLDVRTVSERAHPTGSILLVLTTPPAPPAPSVPVGPDPQVARKAPDGREPPAPGPLTYV